MYEWRVVAAVDYDAARGLEEILNKLESEGFEIYALQWLSKKQGLLSATGMTIHVVARRPRKRAAMAVG